MDVEILDSGGGGGGRPGGGTNIPNVSYIITYRVRVFRGGGNGASRS